MKVLATGGAGFIGSHTVVELLNKNYQVVIIDNFCKREYAVSIPLRFVDRRLGDVEISFANVDKANNLLGWEANILLKTVSEMRGDLK